MLTARASLAVVAVGGRFYAVGGWNETYLSPLEEYDPETDQWQHRTPMLTARTGLAAVEVGGQIYVIGGYDGNRRLGTVEMYDPPFYDTDGDGIADDEELRYGRDPLGPETDIDTDGDGLTDVEEATQYGTNPWIPDTDADTDGDGLPNVEEVDLYGTSPSVADTDEDGLTDGVEVITYDTDPLVVDSDGDGLSDGKEVDIYQTDPLNEDSDGDNYSDGEEVAKGTDPNASEDYPVITKPETTTGPRELLGLNLQEWAAIATILGVIIATIIRIKRKHA